MGMQQLCTTPIFQEKKITLLALSPSAFLQSPLKLCPTVEFLVVDDEVVRHDRLECDSAWVCGSQTYLGPQASHCHLLPASLKCDDKCNDKSAVAPVTDAALGRALCLAPDQGSSACGL